MANRKNNKNANISSNNSLKILQWNCRSAMDKINELRKISDDYDVIILSETWLTKSSNFKINNFNQVRNDRTQLKTKNRTHNPHGGVCILIKKNIPFEEISNIYNNPKQLETAAVTIELNDHEKLLICSIYRNPDEVTNITEWKKLLDSTNQYENKIIGGDFNAHDLMWSEKTTCVSTNSCKACKTGENLVELLNNSDLLTMNDKTMTYVSDNTKKYITSAVDITMISANLYLKSKWKVQEDKMFSDHYPIQIELFIQPKQCPLYSTHKLNTRKVQWPKFTVNLQQETEKWYPEEKTEEFIKLSTEMKYEFITNNLIQALNLPNKRTNNRTTGISADTNDQSNNNDKNSIDRSAFIKNKLKKTHNAKPPEPIWWNEETDQLILDRKKLEKRVLKNPCVENLKILNSHNNRAKRKIKQTRIDNFRNYTGTNLSRESSLSTVWKTVSKFNGNKEIYPQADLETIKNMNKFIDEFCPPYPSHNEPPQKETDSPTNGQVEYLDIPFNISELNLAIDAANVKSSPGLDQITNEMLKNSPKNFRSLLLHTFNDIFLNHKYPKDWNEFLMVLIPKNSKNKFRPITMASCLLKIMEKMIQIRILHFLE